MADGEGSEKDLMGPKHSPSCMPSWVFSFLISFLCHCSLGMEAIQAKLDEVVASLNTQKFSAPTVSRAEVLSRLAKNDDTLVLLDTRADEEVQCTPRSPCNNLSQSNIQRDVSTIPGSIDIAQFEAHPEIYKDKDVVAFCTVGYLSAAKVCEYQRKGLANVRNMGDGALLGYTLAMTSSGVKSPLVKKDGSSTNAVHTFMPDLAPLAGEGMEGTHYSDPGSVLSAANARILESLGL